MDLPNLLSKIKSSPELPKQFIAIEISANAVKTAIWQVLKGQTQIVSIGSIQDWDTDSDDDLLVAIDTSLSESLAGIEAELTEVIFGLPETWVGTNGIAETQKPTLKNICSKLGLKPVGFVVTTEAVVHYLQDTEGGPPSAILARINPSEIIVSLVQLGKLEGAHAVGRSSNISSDIEEGLARFSTDENLPTRIILYDSKEDLENIKQDLIAHDWQKKLSFLHFPQIEIIPKDGTINAIAISGGAEVAKSLGLSLVPKNDQLSAAAKSKSENQDDQISSEDSQVLDQDESNDQLPPDSRIDFGFSPIIIDVNQDPDGEDKPEVATEPDSNKQPSGSSKSSSHPLDSDAADVKIAAAKQEKVKEELVPVNADEIFHSKEDISSDPKKSRLSALKLSSLFQRKPKVKSWAGKPKLPGFKLPSILILGFLIIAILFGAGIYYYWNIPSAEVTIYLEPETLDREIEFTLNPNSTQVDLESGIIPGVLEDVQVSGNQQTPATGSLTVGERAVGNVDIFNRTLSSKTLPSGTVIKKDSLHYTLNDDVTIASASSQENEDFSITRKPTSAQAAVTAADIGDQYNIGADAQFSVANFSNEDFIAKAISNFSGGTSQEIQAVSANDIDRLRQDLIDQLTGQISQEVSQKSDGQKGVISASDPEIADEEFSAEEGEEAQTVDLTASLAQIIFIYNKKDISLLGQQQLINEIPSGFSVVPTATQVEVIDSTINEDDTVTISAKVSLKLLPQVDMNQIIAEIKGKYPQDAESYLQTLPNYAKTEVTISPKLPNRLNTFPKKAENIHLKIGNTQ